MNLSLDEWARGVQQLPYFGRRIEISSRIKPRLRRFLYKYKSIDVNNGELIKQSRDILVDGKLWLSSPTDFNDPFDMSAKIIAKSSGLQRRKRMDKVLKQTGVKWKERQARIRRYARVPVEKFEHDIEKIYIKNLKQIGVFSFAGDPRNILMWSHYANNHSGFCIQFEVAHDFYTLSHALPVEYSQEYPEMNWVTEGPNGLEKIMLRKHMGWSYESEQRIVMPGEAHKYLTFEPQAATSIIFGCRISSESKNILLKLLKERQELGLPEIKIYKAVKSKDQYKLSIFSDK